jgi:hypothetical protein
MPTAPTESPRSYDLCINVAGRRLYWRNPNHGITLGADSITWTMDGSANEMAYGNIVAVHLDSAGQKVTADRCTITFADGRGLLVVNTDPGGYRDAKRGPLYRDFVRDLHARLSANGCTEIRYTAGVPRWRYRAMLIGAAIATPVFCLSGLLQWLLAGDLHGLGLAILGGYFCWTLVRRALANAPRDYTPEKLPQALLS